MTATGIAIIQKDQNVRVGPFPIISGVIVKSGEKFRLDPNYKPAPLPFKHNMCHNQSMVVSSIVIS